MTVELAERVALPAGRWTVDPAHSSIEFGIKHLLITTVKGAYGTFEGVVEVSDEGAARASAVVRAASIDTREPQRDEHLRSPDFFAADEFPEIRFESSLIEPLDPDRFRIVGDIEIKGTKRPFELEAHLEGAALDPWGNERLGLSLRGQLDPNEFGVDWNQELETGGNLVGDRVDVVVNVSAVKAA